MSLLVCRLIFWGFVVLMICGIAYGIASGRIGYLPLCALGLLVAGVMFVTAKPGELCGGGNQ